jgi:hypothetical protein
LEGLEKDINPTEFQKFIPIDLTSHKSSKMTYFNLENEETSRELTATKPLTHVDINQAISHDIDEDIEGLKVESKCLLKEELPVESNMGELEPKSNEIKKQPKAINKLMPKLKGKKILKMFQCKSVDDIVE